QYADNGGFVFGSSSSNSPLALTDVHVPRFAADESFIHFDFSGEFATKEIILHGKPDAMKHEPRRLLSYFDIPRNLVTADSIFAVSDQPSSSEPFIQRNRGIFHHGADLDGKLALRMMLRTSPSAPLITEFDSLATASWANDFSVRPAADSKIVNAVIGIGEIDDCFLQALWFGHGFVLHIQNYIQKPWSSQLYYCPFLLRICLWAFSGHKQNGSLLAHSRAKNPRVKFSGAISC